MIDALNKTYRNPTRILHLSTSDNSGGAARATYRLHKALLKNGIDSLMLVKDKYLDDYSVINNGSIIEKGLNKLRPHLDSFILKKYKDKDGTFFSPSLIPSRKIIKKVNELNPDVVHIHWICLGFISIKDLYKIKAPIIWTLHDNWPFTGGCHIMWDCDKYKESCGACPRLNSKKNNDISRKVYLRKKKYLSRINYMTIVGVSHWMSKCAAESSLFKNRKVLTLPNPINVNTFRPINPTIARDILNLPSDKKIILFGALSATSDINKGFEELVEALKNIESDNVQLLVFGSRKPEEKQNFKFEVTYLGQVHDDVSLQLIYSAADVMVVPSRQESFGQTASEAMACGTPVVAFGHTGLLDIIDHKVNGYLAIPRDSYDMAKGIDWILNNKDHFDICDKARKKVISKFDDNIVATGYTDLYKDILNG